MDERKQQIQLQETQTRRINLLIRKYKDGMKKKNGIVKVGEPVILLTRRNQRIEFIETNGKLAEYTFKHSGGEIKTIPLIDAYICTASYGTDTIKCYQLHEDWAFPMPPKPLIEAKEFKNAVDNAMSAEMKWKAEEKKAQSKMLWAVAGIIGTIGIMIILYVMLKPQPPAQIIQIVPNGTPTVLGLTLMIPIRRIKQ